MKKLFSRGVVLQQNKEPAISSAIKRLDDIETVFLPVSDDLCVSNNEKVKRGQLISKGSYPDSIDSFASVNGKTVAVGTFELEKFEDKKFVQINADNNDGFPDVDDFLGTDISDEDMLYAALHCGVINNTDKMPLSELYEKYKDGVKNLVIDAVDDEPYVSCKTVQLLFRGKQTAEALDVIKRLFKPENISIEVYGCEKEISVKIPKRVGKYPVVVRNERYPVSRIMHSDKQTLYLGIGALLSFYYSAAMKSPWTYTVVTVAGDCIKNPVNVEVPIGTTIADILNECGMLSKPETVILGGSMTGYVVDGADTPVLKSTKAILAFSHEFETTQSECIGCGRCIDVCPEKLLPYYIYKYNIENNIDKLYHLSADKCTECGSCSYICPAKIDLRQYVKKSRRTLLKEMWQNEQNGQNTESTVSEK